MTDGRIVYDSEGVETKHFHVRDGLAIKLWIKSGFSFGIITARSSKPVSRRAGELGIEHVHQGVKDKRAAAAEICARIGCQMAQVCYVGDDLPDIPVMRTAGLSAAPADASSDARATADWVLRSRGGEAALRELIERLLRAKQRWEEHVR